MITKPKIFDRAMPKAAGPPLLGNFLWRLGGPACEATPARPPYHAILRAPPAIQ